MTRFLVDTTSIPQPEQQPQPQNEEAHVFNPDDIVCDPALRKQISDYHPSVQDQVRRAYLLKGPTQPIVNFPKMGSRGFSKDWYRKYDWIEYSESNDKAYCFHCFLFKQVTSTQRFGYDVFTKTGFSDWKHAYKALPDHIGGISSDHNNARLNCDAFCNQRQSVSSKLSRATKKSEELYKIRLTSSMNCARFLIGQGLAFRGHNESLGSLNMGNFRELVEWYKRKDDKVKHAYGHGGNSKMVSPKIQKDLTKCCAQEVTKVILGEIGKKKFSVLIDESRDISVKEQMAVMLRLVVLHYFIIHFAYCPILSFNHWNLLL
jgi:hypothetical protein